MFTRRPPKSRAASWAEDLKEGIRKEPKILSDIQKDAVCRAIDKA